MAGNGGDRAGLVVCHLEVQGESLDRISAFPGQQHPLDGLGIVDRRYRTGGAAGLTRRHECGRITTH